MTERLLQYIWQFQHFNSSELRTTTEEPLLILQPGLFNHNQGPDFLDARIRSGDTVWAGHVEIHIRTSDWNRHGHTGDKHYSNVILHVVWENDLPISDLPVLELNGRVAGWLLSRYEELMAAQSFIPCGSSIGTINPLVVIAFQGRLLAERLERRAAYIRDCLAQNQQHWEETCWWLLAKNFGCRLNEDAFEAVARSLPVRLLARHKGQIHQLEALLFGQAGLLDSNFAEDYPALLRREYEYLQKKYALAPIHHRFHFLRMRPVNFPTVRLAQLAALINRSTGMFSEMMSAESIKELYRILDCEANDYWHYHFRFDEPGNYQPKRLGKSMLDTLIINTAAPLLFAYGLHHDNDSQQARAIHWLEELAAEKNKITSSFRKLGVAARHAADSQGLLELKAHYCDKKKCLDCAIGAALLK